MDIRIEGVEHVYMTGTPFEKKAIHDINLEIKSGSLVGLIGHTGSGKSTLVQHLNGLLKPTNGKIFIDNKDISSKEVDLKQLRFKVGLVFQYPEHQLFDETVFDDIAFGPKNIGLDKNEINERVEEAITRVGLSTNLLSKSPFDLSGGQKRRVAIAGVLAMDPEILILDEPAAGLDPKGRKDILNNICSLQKSKGITVILVSHSMEDIARICSKIIVMNDGTIAMQGSVEEIFSRGKELKAMHLDVPQITSLVSLLRERGISIPADIYTTSRAKEEILKLFK